MERDGDGNQEVREGSLRASSVPTPPPFRPRRAGRGDTFPFNSIDADHCDERTGSGTRTGTELRQDLIYSVVPGILTSAVLHLSILVICCATSLAVSRVRDALITIHAGPATSEADLVELSTLHFESPTAVETPDLLRTPVLPLALGDAERLSVDIPQPLVAAAVELQEFSRSDAVAMANALSPSDVQLTVGDRDGGLAVRSQRRQEARAHGASERSEQAVEKALAWLARHQRPDGSWSLNHRAGPIQCQACQCGDPFLHAGADSAATGLVLLAFLGGGHTHRDVVYGRQIQGGLGYLITKQLKDHNLMDRYGRMYSHGIATLALTEALAMARYQHGKVGHKPLDKLPAAAQSAIEFIEKSQHTKGGWRYRPREEGDTSVVGWQLMALKSGHLAGLKFDPKVIDQVCHFLDDVKLDKAGSRYGYMRGRSSVMNVAVSPTEPMNSTTPIGLLCRMYTGWDRDEQGLVQGVPALNHWQRPDMGMYFYYYATQVMYQYGGEPWTSWNGWMRDYLVENQDQVGSQAGSWRFQGEYDSGRLYCTAMAAMTLEIYYRYSPIYGDEALGAVDRGVPGKGMP